MRLTTRLLIGASLIIGALSAYVAITAETRMRRVFLDGQAQHLARAGRFVAAQWHGGAAPGAIATPAAIALGAHVTIVDRRGLRLADSDVPAGTPLGATPLDALPEVKAALAFGTGINERRNGVDDARRLFVAVPAKDGAVRLDAPTASVLAPFDAASGSLYGAGALAIVLALIGTYVFARGIAGPIEAMRDVARGLAAGDLTRRPDRGAPGELGELEAALHGVAEQLGARIAALSSEDALLRATLEALNEGVVAIDGQRRVIRINATGRTLLDVGFPLPFPASHLPRERVLREALDAALAGDATGMVETEIAGRIIALTALPLASGGAVIAVFDLTKVRRLELVRRDFVANVSHELKTPLTIISGFAETLLDPGVSAEHRQQFAATVLSNARRMQRLVDDLLDLSRIESGGWIPNPEWIPLASAIPEATAVSMESAGRRGISFEVALAPDAHRVWADQTAVRQVLGNLAENAVRHTTTGSVAVFTEATYEGIWLGVRDTGSGIPAEHLPRIFERFYRVDPGRSRDAGGTGLGLAIVKHLAEAHGGRIRAESVVGAGTTVACLFPNPSPRGA